MNELLSLDPGYGAIKLFGRKGGLVLPSNVSVALDNTVGRMAGLRAARPPLRVETDSYSFYVGAEALAWGNPVENLDLDRLTGSPEMRAVFCGALTKHGMEGEVDLIVGLPVASLTSESTTQGIVESLKRTHEWKADSEAHGSRSGRSASPPNLWERCSTTCSPKTAKCPKINAWPLEARSESS